MWLSVSSMVTCFLDASYSCTDCYRNHELSSAWNGSTSWFNVRFPRLLHYVRLGVCFPCLAYRFANAEHHADENMTRVHFLRCEMGPPNLEINSGQVNGSVYYKHSLLMLWVRFYMGKSK